MFSLAVLIGRGLDHTLLGQSAHLSPLGFIFIQFLGNNVKAFGKDRKLFSFVRWVYVGTISFSAMVIPFHNVIVVHWPCFFGKFSTKAPGTVE